MSITIKETLWSAIQEQRRLDSAGIEELGKRFGLNGHDLAKNLDQLGKEGKISVRWSGSRMVSLHLRRKSRADSTASRVYNWIASRDVMGAWIEATPNQIRDELKAEGNAVSVAISDLLRDHRIEARRNDGNRRITALRIPLRRAPLVVVDQQTGSTIVTSGNAQLIPPPPEAIPDTPNLDAYLSARRIARLAPAHNPYLTIEFTENPIAEEALVLRERLARALER